MLNDEDFNGDARGVDGTSKNSSSELDPVSEFKQSSRRLGDVSGLTTGVESTASSTDTSSFISQSSPNPELLDVLAEGVLDESGLEVGLSASEL